MVRACIPGFRRRSGLSHALPCTDRLAELKVGMPSAGADIELGVPASAQSPAMTAFFEEVSAVKKSMQTIKYNIKLIEQSHGECLTAISAEQQRECTDRLEGLMKETNGAAQAVRNKLKAMDLENKEFAKRNEGASEARIASNTRGPLTLALAPTLTPPPHPPHPLPSPPPYP